MYVCSRNNVSLNVEASDWRSYLLNFHCDLYKCSSGLFQFLYHGMEKGYLKEDLSPVTPTCTIRSSWKGMLWVTSTKEYYLIGPKRESFSAMVPDLWKIFRLALILLAFWKGLKTWLCHLAWRSGSGVRKTNGLFPQIMGFFCFLFLLFLMTLVTVWVYFFLWGG